MNCKQGDLAIIVRSYAGNEGKIVRCVEYIGRLRMTQTGSGPVWRVDRVLTHHDLMADCCLRPLRPDKGEDEMLRIAGKPQETATERPVSEVPA